MYFDKVKDFTKEDFNLLKGFFGDESNGDLIQLYNEFTHATKQETHFFNQLGISQSLFDKSQLLDKGVGDDVPRSFLLPKPQTFNGYGIKNVTGEQSLEILNTDPIFVQNAKAGYDVIID